MSQLITLLLLLTCPWSLTPLGTPVTKSESRQAKKKKKKEEEKETDLVVETWKCVGSSGTQRILVIRATPSAVFKFV